MKQDEGRPGLNLAVLSVILLSASLIVSGCCACGMLKSAIEEPGPGMTVRDNYRGMGLFLYTGSTNLYQKTFLSSEAINYYIYSMAGADGAVLSLVGPDGSAAWNKTYDLKKFIAVNDTLPPLRDGSYKLELWHNGTLACYFTFRVAAADASLEDVEYYKRMTVAGYDYDALEKTGAIVLKEHYDPQTIADNPVAPLVYSPYEYHGVTVELVKDGRTWAAGRYDVMPGEHALPPIAVSAGLPDGTYRMSLIYKGNTVSSAPVIMSSGYAGVNRDAYDFYVASDRQGSRPDAFRGNSAIFAVGARTLNNSAYDPWPEFFKAIVKDPSGSTRSVDIISPAQEPAFGNINSGYDMKAGTYTLEIWKTNGMPEDDRTILFIGKDDVLVKAVSFEVI